MSGDKDWDELLRGLGDLMADQPAGFSIRMQARMFGVSPSTIHRDLQRSHDEAADDGTVLVGKVRGIDGKIRPNRRFDTTERDERITALRREGMSVRTIAATVGCSVGTVHRVISR